MIHHIETPADRVDDDTDYYVAPDPIRLRQAETALLVCQTEIRKRQPNLKAAGDYARRALMLIESSTGPALWTHQDHHTETTTGANNG